MSTAFAFTSGEAILAEGVLLDPLSAPDSALPCRSGDADLWFAESPAELERAKASCLDCPVRAACLAGALARREPWGVWGGEIFERGVVIARKRPRGRPRKNAAVEPAAAQVVAQPAERAAGRERSAAA